MMTDWQTKKLGDICAIGAGNSAPQNKEFFIDGKYPFFRTSDVGVVHIGKIDQAADYLNDKGVKGMRLFRKNTILFPKSGASTFLNHRTIMEVDGYVSSHLATIKTYETVLDSSYLFYFLQEIKAQDLIQDHKYPSLNLPVIEGIEISYPKSLKEQKRIVKKLDEVFEKVTRVKEAAGKNLQNAKELFESYLNGVFANPGKDWEDSKLGDVCDFENGDRGKNYPNKSHRVSKGVPFINAGHLVNDKIDFTDMDYISEERFALLSNGKIKPNDILFCLRGSLGKVANVENLDKGAVASSLVILRSKSELDNDYLLFFLRSNFTKEQILDFGNGAAQPNLSAGSLKKFIIPLPKSLVEQKAIVKKLDALSVETKKLEKIYEQKLADLEELKKSVLQQAFTGKL